MKGNESARNNSSISSYFFLTLFFFSCPSHKKRQDLNPFKSQPRSTVALPIPDFFHLASSYSNVKRQEKENGVFRASSRNGRFSGLKRKLTQRNVNLRNVNFDVNILLEIAIFAYLSARSPVSRQPSVSSTPTRLLFIPPAEMSRYRSARAISRERRRGGWRGRSAKCAHT